MGSAEQAFVWALLIVAFAWAWFYNGGDED